MISKWDTFLLPNFKLNSHISRVVSMKCIGVDTFPDLSLCCTEDYN